jgi:hypothetical protein
VKSRNGKVSALVSEEEAASHQARHLCPPDTAPTSLRGNLSPNATVLRGEVFRIFPRYVLGGHSAISDLRAAS